MIMDEDEIHAMLGMPGNSKSMHLFIDTNIYLKFYHFTSDELEELHKLIVLIDEGEIVLYLPVQVISEFLRNREVKLADALKIFGGDKITSAFPAFSKDYEEYKIMKTAIKEYNESKNRLLTKIREEIEDRALKADHVTKELFEKAHNLDYGDYIEAAKLRFDLGNPPGKDKSYGDAISWETLLGTVPKDKDLYFVSDDKDYFSEIDNKKFRGYLRDEWAEKKNSSVIYYKSISDFFKEKYPDIKLATELQKDLYINRLEESGSFRRARRNIHKLASMDNFTSNQINKIFDIACSNNQVFWIGDDEDINEIVYIWYDHYSELLSEDVVNSFNSKFTRLEKSSD